MDVYFIRIGISLITSSTTISSLDDYLFPVTINGGTISNIVTKKRDAKNDL